MIAVVVLAVGFVVFNETRSAAMSRASARTPKRCGAPASTRDASRSIVYASAACRAALAGLVIAARLGSGSSNAGQGFELDVIAAVVLGGTSLFGGRGTMVGTVLGALTVAVIGNGLILSHLSPFLTPIVEGCIILVAIWMNSASSAARDASG